MSGDGDGDLRREMEWLKAEMKQMKRAMAATTNVPESTSTRESHSTPRAHLLSSNAPSSEIAEVVYQREIAVGGDQKANVVKQERSESQLAVKREPEEEHNSSYDRILERQDENNAQMTSGSVHDGRPETDAENGVPIVPNSLEGGLPVVRQHNGPAMPMLSYDGLPEIREQQDTRTIPTEGHASGTPVQKRKRNDGDETNSPKKKSSSSSNPATGGEKKKSSIRADFMDMPQGDVDFLFHCVMNTVDGVLVVDMAKIASAMNYGNVRSVGNRIGQMKKKYGVPIKGVAKSMDKTPAKDKTCVATKDNEKSAETRNAGPANV